MVSSVLKTKIVEDLKKARRHLDYSFTKVSKFKFDHEFDEEELETLESFSIRFARYSDLIVTRYFRWLVTQKDPAFRGSVIDVFNLADKYGWLQSKEVWMRVRELRNIAAHEYSDEDYKKLYQELIQLAPIVLNISLTL
jgi:hypothetical protein